MTEEIDESSLRERPEFQGHWDPYVWMDVSLWSECVGFVAKALGEFDPSNSQYYEDNAKEYREELKELDDYVKQVIGSVPEEQRVLVTTHDEFGYFGDAYNIEVSSAQELTYEVVIDDISRLVDTIVEREIGAIFVETSVVNRRNIDAVIAAAASRGWTVKIGDSLYSNAMGQPDTYEGTYLGMIDHNATTVGRALGGEAPRNGLNGKLNQP